MFSSAAVAAHRGTHEASGGVGVTVGSSDKCITMIYAKKGHAAQRHRRCSPLPVNPGRVTPCRIRTSIRRVIAPGRSCSGSCATSRHSSAGRCSPSPGPSALRIVGGPRPIVRTATSSLCTVAAADATRAVPLRPEHASLRIRRGSLHAARSPPPAVLITTAAEAIGLDENGWPGQEPSARRASSYRRRSRLVGRPERPAPGGAGAMRRISASRSRFTRLSGVSS